MAIELLLHLDGQPGDAGLIDHGMFNKVVSVYGGDYVTDGQFGQAYKFPGSGYLTLPYSYTDFNWWERDYSIECWVKVHSFSNLEVYSHPNLVGNMGANDNYNYWSFGPVNSGQLRVHYNTGSHLSGGSLTQDQWHHICMGHELATNTLTLYVDGAAVASATVPASQSSSTGRALTFGRYYNANMNATVDEFVIRTEGDARLTSFIPPASPEANYPTPQSAVKVTEFETDVLYLTGSHGGISVSRFEADYLYLGEKPNTSASVFQAEVMLTPPTKQSRRKVSLQVTFL